jgi:hypothetical protein
LKPLQGHPFNPTAGAENDKNFIYGTAFVGPGSVPGGTLAGRKRVIVRLEAIRKLDARQLQKKADTLYPSGIVKVIRSDCQL